MWTLQQPETEEEAEVDDLQEEEEESIHVPSFPTMDPLNTLSKLFIWGMEMDVSRVSSWIQ